jgi:hypothetical protein
MVKVKAAFTAPLRVFSSASRPAATMMATRAEQPLAETRPARAPKRQRANPDQNTRGSPQREGRDVRGGSFRVHHWYLSLLHRGSFIDGPKKPPLDSVDRIFRCSEGNLTINFTTTGSGLEQRGDWKVVQGFGRLEGLAGGGQMSAVFESERGEGQETLTGTVTR